jgi:sugar O-acyltransferase (sialic acid O-acetyltransferase NeuD family)
MMKKNLIIFGIGKIADVVYYYATEECGYNVVAFVTDAAYKTSDVFHGLPVLLFDTIEEKYPPSEFDMFIGVGYQDLNNFRERKYKEAVLKGYHLVSLVSPKAEIPKNVTIGKNCFIMPSAIIHPFVEIGNNVFVWSGALIGHHSHIGDNCWLTSGCNISGTVQVESNCFFAVNSTVTNEIKIGKNCFLGANTLISKNMNDNEVAIVQSTPIFRLNSQQFLKMSNFR